MCPYISIVINYLPPIKLLSYFLLIGTAISLIACTLTGIGIIPCLVILKPRDSKLSLTKDDFSALILKPNTIFFKLFLLYLHGLIHRSSMQALTYSKPSNDSSIFSWKISRLLQISLAIFDIEIYLTVILLCIVLETQDIR